MKNYLFKATNWKNCYSKPFFFRKTFRSAYHADMWASKFLLDRKSPYIVTLQIGMEESE